MEQRFSIVTLGVSDLNESREFYRRLGWQPSAASNKEIVFFQAGGAALALYPRDELAKDANLAAESQGFGGFTLAYNARSQEEVDTVLAGAEAAGARILKPAERPFGAGTRATSPILMALRGRSPGTLSSWFRRRETSCSPHRSYQILNRDSASSWMRFANGSIKRLRSKAEG